MSHSNDAQPLADRHAVVTGASRGIGAAIVAALAAEGARISLLGRDLARLTAVAAAVGADGSRAVPLTFDVTDPGSIAAAMRQARTHSGPIHILINNAGQATSAPFADTDEALWHRMLDVNLTGAYRCIQQALPDMLEQGFGRIVNVASIAGLRGAAYVSAYVASKHGLVGLTRALAVELARKNITVNAVCPGYTDTDLVRDAVNHIVSKTGRSATEVRATLVAGNPQRRLITPREVAHAVAWLCLPGTESMTGQCLTIAGGEVM